MQLREKKTAQTASRWLSFFFIKRGNNDKNDPLAPKPSRAKLTTMKAKWYHSATENTLVRVISKSSVAADSNKIPKQIKNISGFLLTTIVTHIVWLPMVDLMDDALWLLTLNSYQYLSGLYASWLCSIRGALNKRAFWQIARHHKPR